MRYGNFIVWKSLKFISLPIKTSWSEGGIRKRFIKWVQTFLVPLTVQDTPRMVKEGESTNIIKVIIVQKSKKKIIIRKDSPSTYDTNTKLANENLRYMWPTAKEKKKLSSAYLFMCNNWFKFVKFLSISVWKFFFSWAVNYYGRILKEKTGEFINKKKTLQAVKIKSRWYEIVAGATKSLKRKRLKCRIFFFSFQVEILKIGRKSHKMCDWRVFVVV